jgi:polar amino acid transport system permease protein
MLLADLAELWAKLAKLIPQMCEGTWVSIQIFALTLIFSLPLGLLLAKGRMSRHKWIRRPVSAYLLVMRGTPLILQLIFFYFAPYYLFKLSYDRFAAAILTFTLNYAAYFAEIYRGGIESIPQGQYEAAHVLGFSKGQTFFQIILPQVVKRILPTMGNEFMTLVKDTALAMTLGVSELFRIAQTASAREFSTMPIFVAGVFYFVLNWLVSRFFTYMERRLDYYR